MGHKARIGLVYIPLDNYGQFTHVRKVGSKGKSFLFLLSKEFGRIRKEILSEWNNLLY